MNIDNIEKNEIQFDTPVVSRDSNSVRSARSKIRRRPALFFDPNLLDRNSNHGMRQFNKSIIDSENECILREMEKEQENDAIGKEPVENDNPRNSFDRALEARFREIDDIIGCDDSDTDNPMSRDSPDDMNDEITLRMNNRSESTENLLSMFLTINDEKSNTLDNINELLNHESQHLVLLMTIQKYKYILQESKVSDDVIWHIFFNISDLIYAQKSLVNYLESMTTEWNSKSVQFDEIMGLYTLLHVKCKDYVKNISTALRELKSLFEKNEKFKNAINTVNFEGKKMPLEDLISKPINWLCNSLELIKNLIESADGECDRQKLEESLQILKDNNNDPKKGNKDTLGGKMFLRSSLFVELMPNEQRKLRHLFLFAGMVVCAKQKLQIECNAMSKHLASNHKCQSNKGLQELKTIERFEVKWFISLKTLVFHSSKNIESNDRRKNDIATLKDKIRDLKLQLITEKNKHHAEIDLPTSKAVRRSKSHNFSFRKMMIKKDVDKCCHQMLKIQMDLLLISPTIAFVISNGPERPHTLLVPSIKDLEIWKCEILKAQKDQYQLDCSLTDVNSLLDGFRRYSLIIEAATSPLLHEEGVSGVLVTTIHKVDGLNPDVRYLLSIEVDSFKLNELKARTKSCTGRSSLSWNESFDIDLDCSQTMNILVYELKNYGENKESLVGYFEFNLISKEINNKTLTKTVSMLSNESIKLTIEASFKFEAKTDFMKRQPSIMKAGLFGINLKSIVSREKAKGGVVIENVPMIIVSCFKFIEERGLDEEGIYRISGSKNEITELYKRLNKNVLNALQNLGEYDLHSITGIVKMYLRELPEPLLMTDNYNILLKIGILEDAVERFKQYEDVIQKLPEPNHSTVIFVLQHFQKVCSHSSKNQMIAGNLGLILGPTLIMPPCEPDKQGFSSTNIAVETMNSMMLARVFTHIMHGICNGDITLR